LRDSITPHQVTPETISPRYFADVVIRYLRRLFTASDTTRHDTRRVRQQADVHPAVFLYNICCFNKVMDCDVTFPNLVAISSAVAQIWRFNGMKKLRHWRANMRHHAKFHADWSNRFRDIAIFQFFKMAAVRHCCHVREPCKNG